MKKIIIIIISVLVVIGCENKQNQTSITSEINTIKSWQGPKRERITIYDCKDINGDYVHDDLCVRIIVREHDDNGRLNKETEYLNNEIVAVIRYRLDDNDNLYMTHTFKGKLITNIYKDENNKWVILSDGKTLKSTDDFELQKPEYCSWTEWMKADLTLIGSKNINIGKIKYGSENNKFAQECYITYTLPDDTEEIIHVKREVLESYGL